MNGKGQSVWVREMGRIYCWVLEREVEVDGKDCKMRFGLGDGRVAGVCPWKNSRMCPLGGDC